MISDILKKQRPQYALAILSFALNSFFLVLLGPMLRELTNRVIAKDLQQLIYSAIGLVLYAIAYFFVAKLYSIAGYRYNCRVMSKLGEKVTSALYQKQLKEFRKQGEGSYLSLYQNDFNYFESNYLEARNDFTDNLFLFVSAVVCMLCISWQLTIITLLCSTLPTAFGVLYSKKLGVLQTKMSDDASTFSSTIKSFLSGFTVIKSFSIAPIAVKEISGKNASLQKDKYAYNARAAKTGMYTGVIITIVVIIIYVAGGFLTVNGVTDFGAITAFIQLMNYISAPVRQLSVQYNKMKGCKEVIRKIEDTAKSTDAHDGSIALSTIQNIAFSNVSFAYQNKPVLHDVSFTLEQGKSYAVVGPNGSGKSTVISLINHFYDDYTGTISINGHDLREIKEDDYQSKISFVQQDVFIFNDTIRNNIMLYQSYPEEEVQKAIALTKLDGVIAQHGADTPCIDNGNNLSGGERQRISVARALLKKSEVLILDEGLSAIDETTSREIERDVLAVSNTMKIMITHDLRAENLRQYDALIMVQNGTIADVGSYDALMDRKGKFYMWLQTSLA